MLFSLLSSAFRNRRSPLRLINSKNFYKFLIEFRAVFLQRPGGISSRLPSLY